MGMRLKLQWIGTALASLLIYATVVWSTDQYLKSQFNPEQFIVASALSHAVHGAPIGSVYRGIAWPFVYQPTDNIQQTVATLKGGALPRGDLGALWPTVPDGLGIVMVATVSVLFKIFGVTLAVFPILAVGLSTISVICLVARFPDSRLFVVPLHFLLLTALLFSPVATEATFVDQLSIGGLRYVSLLAILPGIHIALEMVDRRTGRLHAIEKLASMIQVITFMLCLNVRGGAAYLLFATATMVGLALWAKSAGLNRRVVAIKACSIVSVLALTAIAIHVMAPIDYQREGRVTANFWHRLIVSLGVNPQWPFGDLRSKYDLCAPPYGPPLQSGVSDSNGICIWVQYVRSHGLPENQLIQGVYGDTHERVARAAFIQIALDYPAEVLETLGYYKFITAFLSWKKVMQIDVDAGDASRHVRLFCLIGLSAISLWSAWRQTAFRFHRLAATSVLFLAWSILPILFAWGSVHTMVDIAYWSWATLICMALALIELAKSTWRTSLSLPRGKP
jgi:hypothetical protein